MATEVEGITLKLLVDGTTKKVLYAEAKKDFVDFLFGLLQIPIGAIMGLLRQNDLSVPGSFGSLLDSVMDLETSHFHSYQHKEIISKPKVAYSTQTAYNPPFLLRNFASWDQTSQSQPQQVLFVGDYPATKKAEGYIKEGNSAYMVMDDLVVNPMSTISVFTLLKTFNIKDLGYLEEITVKIDIKKGLQLVKASLVSKTVLTDVFME